MSKATIYCSLTKYLASEHTPFYEIIDSACLTRALKPHVRGVTVFIPPKEVVASIAGLLASSQQKDVKEGHDKIRAYIIGDVFATPEEFKSSDKHIVNYLGNIVKVEVSGNNVTVVDGTPHVKLTLDPGARFLDRETGPRVAVWMASGALSGKGEKFSKSTPPKKNKRAVGGYYGGSCGDNGGQVDRQAIEEFLRSTFAFNVARSRSCNMGGHYINPYIKAMNQLYEILEHTNKELFDDIIKYKDDLAELDFYMFVQPFSTLDSDKFIPDDVICEWCKYLTSDTRAPLDTNAEYIKRGTPLCTDVIGGLETIVNTYLETCEYDIETITAFYARDSRRAWCDEMRIRYKLKFIAAMYSADPPGEYTSIVNSIKDNYPHKDSYDKESHILSGKNANKMIQYMISTDVLSYVPGAVRDFGDRMDPLMSSDDLINTLRESNVFIPLSKCAQEAYSNNVMSSATPQYGVRRSVPLPFVEEQQPSTSSQPMQTYGSAEEVIKPRDNTLGAFDGQESAI